MDLERAHQDTAAVRHKRDGRELGLAKVERHVDVPFGVGCGAGKEVGAAFIE